MWRTYDGAGNMLSDNRLGSSYAYTYNNANRLKTVSFEGNLRGTYTYNGMEQLIVRVVTNSGTANGTTHYLHDRGGNIIAETNGIAAGTTREYISLPEAEIAPTIGSRTVVDKPVAVVDGVNLTVPATWMVHVDHLHRPIRMTDTAKAAVWQATWSPWGAPYQITGSAVLDARLPGQWFQLEAGLHYNWHRHYDATLGRYTQPDPLGFVDGPSVYGYAGGSPEVYVDPDGRDVTVCYYEPHDTLGLISHVGFGVNSSETSGFYPKGGFPKNVKGPGEIRPDSGTRQCKVLETDKDQDDCLKQCESDRKASPGTYSLAFRQCTSYVRDCLINCKVRNFSYFGPAPGMFYNRIK